jgi:nucleoside-triphosphatase THEP1
MTLDVRKFYQATNPSKTLSVDSSEQDRKYYIDFSSVRGDQVIEELKNQITFWSSDEPTCQLFTGHVGCGKSTELRRLKAELEAEGFHVVYFESDESLEMEDVDISDILLAITSRVSKSLENIGINLKPGYFQQRFAEIQEILKMSMQISEMKFSVGIAEITSRVKDSPNSRDKLRQYLEPQTKSIIEAINQDILKPAIENLMSQGRKGLVVIVDNLDRVANKSNPWGRKQQEYIFVDRGDQLRSLNCHLVYTMPLALRFSNDFGRLYDRFEKIRMLPMVPVKSRNSNDNEEGIFLLRQMVLARAFPELNEQKRLDKVCEIFDTSETLDYLCRVSGGHIRQMLRLLNNSIGTEMGLPISRRSLEEVIRMERNTRILAITDDEWNLLRKVKQTKKVIGDDEYETLIRSMFVYEYRDEDSPWFDINPVLADAKELNDESK